MSSAVWRAMAPADLPAVSAIAAAIHPGYRERDEVFAERLALDPEGCRVLILESAIAGYIVSHPWHALSAPALDTLLSALPSVPATYYIHDIALLPRARGQGAAQAAVAAAERRARSLALASLSLVTVEEAAGFWRAARFVATPLPLSDTALATYGDGALFMMRPVPG